MADYMHQGPATVASLLGFQQAGRAGSRVAGQGAAMPTAVLPLTRPCTFLTSLSCCNTAAIAAAAADAWYKQEAMPQVVGDVGTNPSSPFTHVAVEESAPAIVQAQMPSQQALVIARPLVLVQGTKESKSLTQQDKQAKMQM